MESIREQLLLLTVTPLYILVIGFEIALSHFRRIASYTWRDTLTNLYLMAANTGVDLLFRGFYVVALGWFLKFHFFQLESPLWYWFWLVIGMDFLFYWLHRVDHHCRFFWAVHVTHHSSEKFNLTVGFRSSVFQPLYRFIYFIPLALAGFKPLDIGFVFSATQIWGILVHTEHVRKLGWLEHILVTPSHHRVHHASNPLYLDRNLGMLLIVWDKWFGTFQPEVAADQYQPIRYGLTKPLESPNGIRLIFHEWANIWQDIRNQNSFGSKLRCVFGPPGWSADGSTLTSDQMRAAETVERHNPAD